MKIENGKIIGFSLPPNRKGAKISFVDNVMEQGEYTTKEYTLKVDRQVSNNFYTILRALVGHAIYNLGLADGKIAEKELKERRIVDMPKFKQFRFKGFKLSGDAEDEKIVVQMDISNINDEMIPVNSGKIGVADGKYAFEDILVHDLDAVIEEAHKFIQGTNYYKQAELPFPEEVTNSVDEDEL